MVPVFCHLSYILMYISPCIRDISLPPTRTIVCTSHGRTRYCAVLRFLGPGATREGKVDVKEHMTGVFLATERKRLNPHELYPRHFQIPGYPQRALLHDMVDHCLLL